MRRFFCDNLPHPRLPDALVALGPDESRHARRVLRLRRGDAVELFNGSGSLAQATVEGFEEGLAVCRVTAVSQLDPPSPSVTVWAPTPKAGRVEQMVDQLTQVGADHWQPIVTKWTVVDPRPTKLDRLGRVALEAAKQCHRLHTMQIGRSTSFEKALAHARTTSLDPHSGHCHIMLDPQAKQHLGPAMVGEKSHVHVWIGPEGGWTESESNALDAAGCTPARLGPHIMRIETAAIAAVVMIRGA